MATKKGGKKSAKKGGKKAAKKGGKKAAKKRQFEPSGTTNFHWRTQNSEAATGLSKGTTSTSSESRRSFCIFTAHLLFDI